MSRGVRPGAARGGFAMGEALRKPLLDLNPLAQPDQRAPQVRQLLLEPVELCDLAGIDQARFGPAASERK